MVEVFKPIDTPIPIEQKKDFLDFTTTNILNQEKYRRTGANYLIKTRQGSVAGSGDIYEVPLGKMAYITNVSLCCRTNAVGDGFAYISVIVGSGSKGIIFFSLKSTSLETYNQSLNFSVPLVLPAGHKILLAQNNTAEAFGVVIGWEEQADEII